LAGLCFIRFGQVGSSSPVFDGLSMRSGRSDPPARSQRTHWTVRRILHGWPPPQFPRMAPQCPAGRDGFAHTIHAGKRRMHQSRTARRMKESAFVLQIATCLVSRPKQFMCRLTTVSKVVNARVKAVDPICARGISAKTVTLGPPCASHHP
jgi:hypothetical protein